MPTLTTLALTLLLAASPAQTGLDQIRSEAEHGDPDARLELGILYEFGFGMKDNEEVALAWYMLAADAGSARGAKRRDLLLARLPPPKAEAARRLAGRLAKKATAPAAPKTSAP